MKLSDVYNSAELLEVGRKAVEDALIVLRDNRISRNRNNGLVIKEYDGTSSSVIRLGPEEAIRIGLKAIEEHLNSNQSKTLTNS